VGSAQHSAQLGRQVAPPSAGWQIADDGAHFPQRRPLLLLLFMTVMVFITVQPAKSRKLLACWLPQPPLA
jgi:hypothetical protein